MRPDISVIIPIFNNMETLPSVLRALNSEKICKEIILVDNGSTDGSKKYAADMANKQTIYFFEEEKRGAGAARNTGATYAKSPVLLFLGADILPQPGFVREHVMTHRIYSREKDAVLGYVTWDPFLPPSPFMVYLEHGGPQNAYDEIAGMSLVDPCKYFYGSNISLKKTFFDAAKGFDVEHFSGYGWEDVELGIRLKEKGLQLHYEPAARGYHRHLVSVRQIRERMVQVGKGYVFLKELHPDIEGMSLNIEAKKYLLRRLIYSPVIEGLLTAIAEKCENSNILRRTYRRVLSLPFYKGVHDASRDQLKNVDKPQRDV